MLKRDEKRTRRKAVKRRFVLNAVIMTGSALLTHTMAAGFRVYMSNTIGSGGIGLYQLICTIYFSA